jgi:GH25 family lysozyme M1 (1,4-beta-N-acetylmuramidase)
MSTARTRNAWLLVVSLLAGCSGAPPDEGTASISEPLQQCPSQTVEGVDVFEGQGSIDWTLVKNAGVSFAMIKATQGTYNTQSTFSFNWSHAKSAGLSRSAYHFFDPTEDGIAQAQHYLSVVGAPAADDLPPMLDIECPDGSADCLSTGASGQAPASTIHQRMWDWIHTVEQSTGKKSIVYTYGSYFSSNAIDTTGLDAYPLFIAAWTTASCFNVPGPWVKAAFWQYSSTGTVSGISGHVDRDRFIGTLAALQSFALGGASVDGGTDASPPNGGALDAGEGGYGDGDAKDGGGPVGATAETGADSSDGTGNDSATDDGAAAPPQAGDGGAPNGSSSGCACRAAPLADASGSRSGAAIVLSVVLAMFVRKTRQTSSRRLRASKTPEEMGSR